MDKEVNSTKEEFIRAMMQRVTDNKTNKHTRDRILTLIAKEIGMPNLTRENVVANVEEIKRHSRTVNISKENDKVENFSNSKKKIHNPTKVINWLKLFTRGNSHIKYSTHIWDEEKYSSYSMFTEGLNEDIKKERLYEMANYSSNLYWKKIYPFLAQEELTKIQKAEDYKWGQYNLKLGWQYPLLLKDWCAENFDNKGTLAKKPMEMEIPEEYQYKGRIKGKTIKYFEDIVNVFKEEIEFRNNNLYTELKILCNRELTTFNLDKNEFETLKGQSFYTNTEYVLKAITRVFKMIKARNEYENVTIRVLSGKDNKFVIIEILQKLSYSLKYIDNPKLKLDDDSGDFGIIRTTLTSLCDFAVESKFRDNKDNRIKSYHIDYLYEGVSSNNWLPKFKEMNSEAEGFKYIFKFYL